MGSAITVNRSSMDIVWMGDGSWVSIVLSNILSLYNAANLEIPVNDRAEILYCNFIK